VAPATFGYAPPVSALGVDARADDHDHVVAFYEGERDLIGAVAAHLAPALGHGGAAVVVATAPRRRALDLALAQLGFPVEALTAAGRYRSFDARATLDTFMRDGSPDPELFTASVGPILEDGTGANGVRVFGEMVALLWDDGNVAGAVALESLWNDLAARQTFALFCAYPASVLDGSDDLGAAKAVCDRHSHVVALAGATENSRTLAADRDEVVRSFAPTVASLHAVRAFVDNALDGWQTNARARDTAAVIVSELATNAIAHARSPFRVSLARTPSAIQIAVRDASDAWPQAQSLNAARMSGRGIVLVGALADEWGTRVEPDGKTVWATLARSTR
jgi:anti-sigma regulatory factor (Ser/Thr protein kinase)